MADPLTVYLMKKIIGRFKIPLEPNAPVSEGKYPILILSHGLAGTRTTYR
jgi:predicted dienelactone hydrolase